MPNIQIESYRTRDLGEAGALLMQKQELLSVERDGSTCWFVFKDKTSCIALSSQYFFGTLTVNAREYKEVLDRLKNRIFSLT